MEATTLKARIEQALKTALLARDSETATTLRGLKSVILNAEIATGNREVGLSDDDVQDLFAKEAKKRQESADLYTKGGNAEKAAAELREKALIETYLPAQLSDEQLQELVNETVNQNLDLPMGQMIGLIKQQAGQTADGQRIAAAVRQRMGA